MGLPLVQNIMCLVIFLVVWAFLSDPLGMEAIRERAALNAAKARHPSYREKIDPEERP